MVLSFQNFIDGILNICKNATISKETKIHKIEKIVTATNEYLSLSITSDRNLICMFIGLSKNENTKNEKFYTICGLSTDIEKLETRFGVGETFIQLMNDCCIALRAYVIGVEFLKDEVEQCLK